MEYAGGIRELDDSRTLVRAEDPPGMLTSLRTLARAMLALTDSTVAQPGRTYRNGEDRRRWGVLAQKIYVERKRRGDFFPAELFGEPAWDILLDLFHAAKASELRSIKSACLSSNVPEATALRHIGRLAAAGLAERIGDRTDRRRKFLRLTPLGQRRMEDFLVTMQPLGDQGEDLIRYLAQQG